MRTQPLGGNVISKALKYDLENPPRGSLRLKNQSLSQSESSSQNKGSIEIIPRFRVKERKRNVENKESSNNNNNSNGEGGGGEEGWKEFEGRKDQVTKSYHQYHEDLILEELKESIGNVYPEPWNENSASMRPPKLFEFPNGTAESFGIERSRAFEILFSPGVWRDAQGVVSNTVLYNTERTDCWTCKKSSALSEKNGLNLPKY